MALTALLVLQPANQPCLCMCSLEPGAEDLGEIKAITSAGAIPYVDTERNELFVAEVQVAKPAKRRKKKTSKRK